MRASPSDANRDAISMLYSRLGDMLPPVERMMRGRRDQKCCQTVSCIGRALPRPASTSAEQTRIESIHEDRKPGSEVGFPPTFHQ